MNPSHAALTTIDWIPSDQLVLLWAVNESVVDGTKSYLAGLDAVVSELVDIDREMNRLNAQKQEALVRAARIGVEEGSSRRGSGAPVETNMDLEQQPARSVASRTELALRSVQATIGGELRVQDRTVANWMDFASRLAQCYPATLARHREGTLSHGHVKIIVDEGMIIKDQSRRARYERAILEIARTMSTNRLRPIARRLAEQYTDETLDERHEEARRERGVWVEADRDGMSWLRAYLPTADADAMHDLLSEAAWKLRDEDIAEANASAAVAAAGSGSEPVAAEAAASGDTSGESGGDTEPVRRSMHERRADVLRDLVLQGDSWGRGVDHRSSSSTPEGAAAGQRPATRSRIQVVIPIMSLVGDEHLSEEEQERFSHIAGLFGPAESFGSGPIDRKTARKLAGEAPVWERVLVHPITGVVKEVDRYRPSEQMLRLLGARDQYCRFVGCRAPVYQCDTDHTIDHAKGGATATWNLESLCRRHHTLKHHGNWRVRQHSDGILKWTSPIHRTYVDRPVSSFMFQPRPDARPPTRTEESSRRASGSETDSDTGPPPRPEEPMPF